MFGEGWTPFSPVVARRDPLQAPNVAPQVLFRLHLWCSDSGSSFEPSRQRARFLRLQYALPALHPP